MLGVFLYSLKYIFLDSILSFVSFNLPIRCLRAYIVCTTQRECKSSSENWQNTFVCFCRMAKTLSISTNWIDISTTLLLVSILVRETEIRPIQLFRGGITVPIGIDPRTASATRALLRLSPCYRIYLRPR